MLRMQSDKFVIISGLKFFLIFFRFCKIRQVLDWSCILMRLYRYLKIILLMEKLFCVLPQVVFLKSQLNFLSHIFLQG